MSRGFTSSEDRLRVSLPVRNQADSNRWIHYNFTPLVAQQEFMFQLVVVANNGQYGGSNAYWPKKDPHSRQVFHTYGQPQASIAFLEIDHIGELLDRREVSGASANKWKYPPAGLNMTSPGVSS